MAKQRKVQIITGMGEFMDPNHLCVTDADENKNTIHFENAIIAAGSLPVKLPFLPEDSRIIDSTGALDLTEIPEHLLVIGGGIIGLEMATVYHALGSKITIVEMLDGLMAGADRDIVRPFQKRISKQYENIWLETRVTKVEALKKGMKVSFEGKNAPGKPQIFDCILSSVGRTPNGLRIGAEKAGVAVDEVGFIATDSQMRTNVSHIFAIGDIVGQPMLAHKATHEAKVAAEVSDLLDIPVIGIGAGVDCDGQVLVVYDMLGLSGKEFKFSKNFLVGKGSIADALKDYITAVKNNSFPSASHSYE